MRVAPGCVLLVVPPVDRKRGCPYEASRIFVLVLVAGGGARVMSGWFAAGWCGGARLFARVGLWRWGRDDEFDGVCGVRGGDERDLECGRDGDRWGHGRGDR